MTEFITLSEVVGLIKFIAFRFDDGLAILLGRVPPPSAVEIYAHKYTHTADYGVRISGGERVPRAQLLLESRIEEIIGELGGWGRIASAMQDFRRLYPETWLLFEMHCLFIRPGGIIRDGKGGMSVMIGRRYDGITGKTQRRRRNKLIRAIAQFLITRPDDDKFKLHDDPLLDKRSDD